ncbi:MAG: hypothetical protein RQ754_06050 [Desulfuromonadales bacterium]|nr:hypothetical protein [Desulfuromonadales bacterium]
MKKQMLVMTIVAALMIPSGAVAMKGMDHGDHAAKGSTGQDMKGMDHGKKMDHDSMQMGGKMIMLQDHEVDGVMGSAHMMDVKEKMAEHGMSMTHHFMVGFMDTEGNPVDNGSAAVKVESPDGTVSKPIKMMAMDGSFGADITLDQQGMYHFKVGTKLADGQKRTFHFHYDN